MAIMKKAKYFAKGIKERPKHSYTIEDTNLYESFIKENFGEYTKVWHELYSPDIRLDILIIPPTEENNYYKLVTKGIGAYKMNVPDQIKSYELDRSELVIYLPPNWNFDFKKEENYWVVRQLKIIGRLPIEENSWIGSGHTFSHSIKNDIPFASNNNFTATLLLDAYNEEAQELRIPGKGKINFYQLIPLYKEEIDYKQIYGTEALINKFIENNMDAVVDINRPNCCKDLVFGKDTNDLDEIEKE